MEPDRPLDEPIAGRKRRGLIAAGAVAAVLAAVAIGSQTLGSDNDDDPTPRAGETDPPAIEGAPTGRPEPTYEHNNKPSPIVLLLDDRDVELDPWTYCWSGPEGGDGVASGMCADGMPGSPANMEDVGDAGQVDFWFGMPDWEFEVTFRELGTDCPRSHTVDAVSTGDQTFRIEPTGPAGRYQVDIFGRGNGGDVITSFVWNTSTDGPSEEPEGYLALVTDGDGAFTSYGVELGISDLGFQPREATAEVTVTSEEDRSATFQPRRERSADGDCYEEGSLFFSNRDMDAVADVIKTLGAAPFDYRVVLTIDGQEYVGTARWPRDEKKDEAPNTPLTFEPALPAYGD